MTDTILVPTDGSDPAAAAARHARLLATGLGADVRVLSVVPEGGSGGQENPRTAAESAAADAAALVGGSDADAGETTVEATTVVRQGDPAETILEYADAAHADLIVMGTHGRTGVDRVVSGSVTEHVTRLSEVPVFTARGSETPAPTTYDRLLLPTDGSDCAEVAVAAAIDLARALDASVDVVSVVDVNTVAAQSELTNARLVVDELEHQAQAGVERVADRLAQAGVGGETAVVQGTPATGIADYADDSGADLIVMGTHGRSGLGRFLLGSTTERLIRHAPVPVLSVRAGDANGEASDANGETSDANGEASDD
ncbi:universal stress protein [Halobaculum sp. MBLA0143]|uniref:universal stress protein n=1 Tax=Halobaculum sp. MBLA0143 TaxID=3079933 RepID=UPI00352458E5